MDKIRMAALVAALLSTAGGTLGQGNTLEDLFYAIHQREAEGRVGVIDGYNDGGAALGPMQIHKEYWIDSEVAGKYQDCVNLEYSKRVMLKYWERHCPKHWSHSTSRPRKDSQRWPNWSQAKQYS